MPHSTLYQKILDERAASAPIRRDLAPRPQAWESSDVPEGLETATLAEIAWSIVGDPAYAPAKWCAQPYLVAMSSLDSIDDHYGADSGETVVRYLLSNLAQYRGARARAIKAELRRRL